MADSNATIKIIAIWEDQGAVRKTRELKAEISGLDKVFGSFQTKLLSVAGAWIAYKAITGAVRGTKDFIASLINANAQLELFNTQLVAVLHSQERAREVMEHLEEITITTPVQLQDLTQASIALESAGLNSQKYLRAIVDWSAITKENVAETAVNFAKIASGSKQVSRILATRFIQTSQWNKELERTANSADALANIIERRWGGIGIKMSETFLGVVSNIKDLMFFISAELGKPLFKAVSQDIRNLFEEIQRLRKDGSLKVWAQDILSVFNVIKFVANNIVKSLKEVLFVVNLGKDVVNFLTGWNFVLSKIQKFRIEPLTADDLLPAHTVNELAKRALDILEEVGRITESEALNILKQIQDGVEAFQLGLQDVESLSFEQAIKQLRALDNINFSLDTRLRIHKSILSIQKNQQENLDKQYETFLKIQEFFRDVEFETSRQRILAGQRAFGDIGERGVGFGGVQADFGHLISDSEKAFFQKLSEIREQMANWAFEFRVLIIDTFSNNFSIMVANIVSGLDHIGRAFKAFLQHILKEIIAFFAKLLALKFLGFLAKLIPGFGQFIGLGVETAGGEFFTKDIFSLTPKEKPSLIPSPPSRFASVGSGGVTIQFNAPVYGMNDFEKQVDSIFRKHSSLRA